MSDNFINGDFELDYPKSSTRVCAPGREGFTLRASDWNKACQALVNARDAIISLQELTETFSISAPGLVPAPGTATGRVLTDVGWATPSSGGGFSGAWTSGHGTYNSGSVVTRGIGLFGANVDTTQDPCVTDGDIGLSSDWQFNLGSGSGLGQQGAGLGVLLVNNVNGTNSNCISKTSHSTPLGNRIIIDAIMGGNATADGMYFGFVDASIPTTTGGTLFNIPASGFHGVYLDVWNSLLKASVAGVVSGTTLGYNATKICSAANTYDRWYVDFLDAGATMTLVLRRGAYMSSNTIATGNALEISTVMTWTGLTKPSFSNYRMACGAFTGGFNMKVQVRNMYAMPVTSDWTFLNPLPVFS